MRGNGWTVQGYGNDILEKMLPIARRRLPVSTRVIGYEA